MNYTRTIALLGTVAFTGAAGAGEVFVSGDIASSQTWTADNTYNLTDQVYILPGATLTIEAGTVIASTPTANGSGSLAITRGAKIFVNGTRDNPVIMTSTNDVETWDFVGDGLERDPKTGVWREAANEWGNLTVMGRAYVSNSFVPGNTASCNPANFSPMEGLVPDFENDPNTIYGGGDDEDDSGSISFLSIRYGGRVVGLANELNGLSLGGIGRSTDIDHVEIMNNVDDGAEIWGGTVNIKHIAVWNVGDDSLDIDQGFRGKIQFALIVQGWSVDASQGSGVGDNCFETDGAENSDAQPVTTTVIHNATVVGQPLSGDGGTTWRDNARVQYRQCIFMDLGDQLVRFDNLDGDGSQGYGFNGTLSWPATWTTLYNAVPAHANDCQDRAARYQSQTAGFLAGIVDSVFFRNLAGNAYTEADARGVRNAGNLNVTTPGFDEADSPIYPIVRGPLVTRGGISQIQVLGLDPRARNDAEVSMTMAPDDGFFTPVNYRGAFAPDENWLCTWTASDAYGFLSTPREFCVSDSCDPDQCPDVDGSGLVDFGDVLAILGAWGGVGNADVDCSGLIDFGDILKVLGAWGDACP